MVAGFWSHNPHALHKVADTSQICPAEYRSQHTIMPKAKAQRMAGEGSCFTTAFLSSGRYLPDLYHKACQ